MFCLPEATVFPLWQISVFIELDVHAKSGTILGPDISSLSEQGLWRQERSESGVRSTESPTPVTPLKTALGSQRRR